MEILTDDDGCYSHKVGTGKYIIAFRTRGYVLQNTEVDLKPEGYKTYHWVRVAV